MKNKIFYPFITLSLICVLCLNVHAERLLLLGNSLSGMTNLGASIQGLATTKGYSLEVVTRWYGGWSLQQWWDFGEASNIESGNYDYVSLQDYSTTATDPARRAQFEQVVPLFDQVIRNSGGETLLYMTWGWSPVSNFSMYDTIDEMYTDMGTQISAGVAPAGRAFKKVLQDGKPDEYLYTDYVHPTPEGTYLVACVFYCTLYGETPEGIEFYEANTTTISVTDAQYLQTKAWETYLEYIPGIPHHLICESSASSIWADGIDFSTITVSIEDDGNLLIADATNQITFSVAGEGVLEGQETVNAVNGKARICLRSTGISGGATVYAVSDGLLPGSVFVKTIAPASDFTQVRINFQPAGAEIPAGYFSDDGSVYGIRDNGYVYGWNIPNTGNTRERDSVYSPDQRYDTLTSMVWNGTHVWEIMLPDGDYSVYLVGGDPSYPDATNKVLAEGVLVMDGVLSSSQKWVEGSAVVTVNDGKLTLESGTGVVYNKICFIDIASVGASTPVVTVSVTDQDASEEGQDTGTFRISRTGSTGYSLDVGYSLGGSALNGTDYTGLSGTVEIPEGSSYASVTVIPVNDGDQEGQETVVLALLSPGSTDYVLGTSSTAIITIADNDDATPPSTVGSVRDGTSVDVDSTTFTTELSANWEPSFDPETGIRRYWYAIGTSAGATDVVDWTDNGTETSVTVTGLILTGGTTYYFTVKAENGVGVESTPASSDGQWVDAETEGNDTQPEEIRVLHPNPYPISRGGSISFRVNGMEGRCRLRIFTMSGRLVRVFTIDTGIEDINWDLLNEEGNNIRPGLYLYALIDSEGNRKIGKIVIAK